MIDNQRMLLVTVVTIILPNDNYALVDPGTEGKKKNRNLTPFYPYLVGLLVLGLMTVSAGVAAYAIYR